MELARLLQGPESIVVGYWKEDEREEMEPTGWIPFRRFWTVDQVIEGAWIEAAWSEAARTEGTTELILGNVSAGLYVGVVDWLSSSSSSLKKQQKVLLMR